VVEAKVEVTFAAALAIQDLKALIVPHARGISRLDPLFCLLNELSRLGSGLASAKLEAV